MPPPAKGEALTGELQRVALRRLVDKCMMLMVHLPSSTVSLRYEPRTSHATALPLSRKLHWIAPRRQQRGVVRALDLQLKGSARRSTIRLRLNVELHHLCNSDRRWRSERSLCGCAGRAVRILQFDLPTCDGAHRRYRNRVVDAAGRQESDRYRQRHKASASNDNDALPGARGSTPAG